MTKRLCSGVRTTAVRRKWTLKSFGTKSTLDRKDGADCLSSIIKNCSRIHDDDRNLSSTTTCTTASSHVAAAKDFEMSPKRALRAAMLKARFADTIFKATHHQFCKSKEQERELEKEKKRARQKIEEELRAAREVVDRSKKTTRENRRAAARMALEKMERSVYVGDDNASILKQLQTTCGDSVAYELFYGKGCCVGNAAKFVNPLEKIGLYLKEDSLEEEDEDDQEADYDPPLVAMELEEGEILF